MQKYSFNKKILLWFFKNEKIIYFTLKRYKKKIGLTFPLSIDLSNGQTDGKGVFLAQIVVHIIFIHICVSFSYFHIIFLFAKFI